MKRVLMSRGADTVVKVCAGVQPEEQVLVVTEAEMMPIAQTVAAAVYAAGAEPTVAVMTPRSADGQEPPVSVAAAMRASDVFFAVVRTSITHTDAVRNAIADGARGIMLTQFSEDMMISGGIKAIFRPAPVSTSETLRRNDSLTTPLEPLTFVPRPSRHCSHLPGALVSFRLPTMKPTFHPWKRRLQASSWPTPAFRISVSECSEIRWLPKLKRE